eukprot:SM000008S22224  [mRNA]  locus=s8:530920:533544:+ [translate_table: standard]
MGLRSTSRASLTWTKSIEKWRRSADQAATLALVKVEKQRREGKGKAVQAGAKAAVIRIMAARKSSLLQTPAQGERVVTIGLLKYKMDAEGHTLQRLPDPIAGKNSPNSPSTPRRASLGKVNYVRLGNGNKLIRDPKTTSRVLASARLRYSLHNARRRRLKKQQHCQFFTRFGKCNKSDGDCLYIHDIKKVAVCVKFLRGKCMDDKCPLMHKVIPERMPDCSYYLQGMCANESCPYRHVCVHPDAPVCQDFLKGYCSKGDECDKKHSYVCHKCHGKKDDATGATYRGHHIKANKSRGSTAGSGKRLLFSYAQGLPEPAEERLAKKPRPPPDLGDGGIPLLLDEDM